VPKESSRVRLDVLLVERGLIDSRELARRMVMAGEVTVDNQIVSKPGMKVPNDANLVLKSKPRFVSRGGEKLAAALDRFQINPAGWVCADAGASTGGFTDVLLQADAAKVYAVDVGYGQLAWQIRQDPRVVVMERVNARYLEVLPEAIDFAVVDVSFISQRLILPRLYDWLHQTGQAVTLVKPQFEAGRSEVGKGGVVKDPAVHAKVLRDLIAFAISEGFYVLGLIPSPLHGPAGNIEFLLWLGREDHARHINAIDVDAVVQAVHAKSTDMLEDP
jgi:23S rRNA (cytidine1920-2'-O)/16S rRNA (cytidine1409-2'-O)-methyltransferase